MKVVFVAHYLSESVGYGLSRYAFNLYNALKRLNVDVTPVHLSPKFASPFKHALDFSVFLPAKAVLQRGDADVYHVCLHQVGHVVPLLKKFRRKKVVTTIPDLHPIIYSGKHASFPFLGRAIKLAVTNSDVLIAISSQTKKDILEHFSMDEKKIVVTPLAIDARFRPLKKKKDDIFTVGYLGGFAGNKDVPFLIRAYAIFENSCGSRCRLLLYGKGADLQKCVALAKSMGIKNAEFKGFAPDDKIVDIYNSFDLFVFPSDAEGFGLPILEAQKCGVPTVVKEKTRIPEEVTKFCLKAKDEEHLAKLMEKVRTEGFTFTKEHQKHLAQFTWENCAKKTIEAYEQALKS